jgi:hypothetical protein
MGLVETIAGTIAVVGIVAVLVVGSVGVAGIVRAMVRDVK